MKPWAQYKDGNNFTRISAREVYVNERKEPGEWRRKEYFSIHSNPNQRFKMHHKRSSKGKFYFAYYSGQDLLLERYGGGESLTHSLYKEAIGELKSTTIFFGNSENRAHIEITSTELEKEVKVKGNTYYLDVYLKFRSTSRYDLKWNGELGIEVHHTNKVDGKKLADLSGSNIPLIEVNVNKKLAYRYPEDEITLQKEINYKSFLKRYLSKYIWATLLNNPSTRRYLEEENTVIKNRLNVLNKELEILVTREKKRTEREENSAIELSRINKLYRTECENSRICLNEIDRIKNFSILRFIFFKLFSR